MAVQSVPRSDTVTDILSVAQSIIAQEADYLLKLSRSLDGRFVAAVDLLLRCQGKVLVTGMGKAGLVGQKLAASFASTGTPSLFFHPAEAVHGDLGCISPNDLIVVLSYSGETEEVTRILPHMRSLAAGVLAITASAASTLGSAATIALELGKAREVGELGLAPSTTTTAMMALGDALALVVSQRRGFTREQFARFHPAGNLGRALTGVREVMRPLDECRVAGTEDSLRKVLVAVSRPGRRSGAIMLVDRDGRLAGIFTDSDLARLLEGSQDEKLDQPIRDVMTRRFTTIRDDRLLPEAMRLLAEKKISELPVVDADLAPVGMIDITDLVSVVTPESDGRTTRSHAAPTGPNSTSLRVFPP
jgi:arabinose-5-phosphate isomerase